MSGRLEEMPVKKATCLFNRLARFYERAGYVVALGKEGREGALSASVQYLRPAAVVRPATQATLHVMFWSLILIWPIAVISGSKLATSYSLYTDTTNGLTAM